ncbi:MAG TPA: hypothetical protein VG847_16615 [Chitinophagaceae bacterium]|nr:hypothetical protein [Chitinophagaceae bacterium]
MSLEEFEENNDKRSGRYSLMKSIMDLAMGFIYIAVGLMVLFANRFHIANDLLQSFTASVTGKIFAGIVILYGLWRIYRGIKKDYFR